MQPPRLVDPVGRTDGQDVGGTVGDAYTGARGGDLHDGLGMVGGRVVTGLVGGADPDAGAVVEGAVVQAGRPAPGRVDHPGDGGGAVGREDGLAGLDLDLEADASGVQAVRLLEGFQEVDEGGDLLGVGDLGQGQHEAVGEPAVLHEPAEEDVGGTDAPVPHTGLHALHPDAHVGGGGAVRVRLGDQAGGAGGGPVLLGVRAGAVTVLEVDTQVLDGLAIQLCSHAVVDRARQLLGDAEDGGERGGVRGVFIEGGERLVAPGAQRAGLEDVTGHIDGVHGLAGAGVARVATGQLRVYRREGGADLLADRTGEARRHLLLLTHDRSLHTLAVSASRNQQSV